MGFLGVSVVARRCSSHCIFVVDIFPQSAAVLQWLLLLLFCGRVGWIETLLSATRNTLEDSNTSYAVGGLRMSHITMTTTLMIVMNRNKTEVRTFNVWVRRRHPVSPCSFSIRCVVMVNLGCGWRFPCWRVKWRHMWQNFRSFEFGSTNMTSTPHCSSTTSTSQVDSTLEWCNHNCKQRAVKIWK